MKLSGVFHRSSLARWFESSFRKRMFVGLFLFLLLVGFEVSQGISSMQMGPDRLEVVHVGADHFAPKGSHPQTSWMTSNVLIVQLLDKMAYLQPRREQGMWSCLNDSGAQIYRLDFYKETQLVQEMRLDLEGCPTLSLSKTDGREPTSSFLWLLSRALNMNTLALPY